MLHFTLPDNSELQLPVGSNLVTIAKLALNVQSPIVEATLNGKPIDLQTPLTHGGKVGFLEMNTEEGMRIYLRTLLCMLVATTEKLYPGTHLEVRCTLGSALYIDCSTTPLNYRAWQKIEQAMHDYVIAKEPIRMHYISRDEAIKIAHERGFVETNELMLRNVPEDAKLPIYDFINYDGFYFGSLCPDAGYVPLFEIIPYGKGIVLNYPDVGTYNELPPFKDEALLQDAFQKVEEWSELVGCGTLVELNKLIHNGGANRMILMAEAWQHRKLTEIAHLVAQRKNELKIILIAGPSSSGKTSTAQRLSIELAVDGLKPLPISMDDYYVNRVDTPKKPNGEYDYECLEAIDVSLFNEHLNKLLAGEEVELPKYNFKSGMREYRGNRIKMTENSVLIIEGIHGLNEKLTATIPSERKLKIYVSALTPMSINIHTRINTTNVRLLRRMVRDNQFRGHDAKKTLATWQSVREGENKYIFPFQGDADVIFNSTLLYELAALKRYAEPLLKDVTPEDGDIYTTAQKLLVLLSFVDCVDEDFIPNDSIIKEFIGGSVFKEVL